MVPKLWNYKCTNTQIIFYVNSFIYKIIYQSNMEKYGF